MSAGFLIFNRVATLQVGLEGEDGRDFSNLRIQFQVEKTSESTVNTSKVTIYNLNRDSRDFLQQQNLVAILSAGYTPEGSEKPITETIFQGDIKFGKVESRLSGPDWITSFEFGDGEKSLVESHFDKSFSKGVSLTDAIGEVAQSLGKPISVIKGLTEKVFQNGLSLSGSSKEILDKLTADAGVEWSIQDDEIIILPKDQGDNQESFLISRNTGLIGSPVQREKGKEFVTALNGALRPGRLVELQSESVNGVLRVRKVLHNGDNLEGPWETKVEAV